MRAVGVYNAEGSLRGELSYVLKKLSGRGSCSLCDITHGWSPKPKRSWREACAESPVELTLLHLDELSEQQRAAFTEAPTILREQGGEWRVVMGAEEIARFKGDAEGLLRALGALLGG